MKNDNQQPFQILALSGGGYRGLFTAKVLEKLEEHSGKRINECFDLICGTSIGGIIALGLGLGLPAHDIARTIEDNGKDIFRDERNGLCRAIHKKFPCLEKLHFLSRARYSNEKLEEVVRRMFGSNKMSNSQTSLIIPAVNYTNGRMQTFKTLHLSRLSPAFDIPMWQAAMATSAAPTYFPIWQNPDNKSTYLDGGLIANAPGLLGIHEATCFLKQDKENIRLLSIGTMNSHARLGATSDLNKGGSWGDKIFDAVTSAQENMANDMLRHILTDERYYYINVPPTEAEQPCLGLDKADKDATDILTAHANSAAQSFVGKPELSCFLQHTSLPSTTLKG